jgi:murein DD-endopeptidase MepM/ murein hydrolase activator NlpD
MICSHPKQALVLMLQRTLILRWQSFGPFSGPPAASQRGPKKPAALKLLFLTLIVSGFAGLIAPRGMVVGAAGHHRATSQGANAPCGVVDAIDYPIDGLTFERDDFGLYRPGFGGRHAGVDMAFARYGDPVKAMARGRVTLADPNAWDTEKGVVIIEHVMPDGSIVFSLYGHMEPINGHVFPTVGQCVTIGEVVGGVGNPSRGAPHLHFEVRTREASQGGPGYAIAEPLDSGWLHPIDFIEAWQLRLRPAFRSMITASGAPTAPPVLEADGSAVFASETHLERRTASGGTLWRLDVGRLVGIMALADGRILGRTADDQIVVVTDGNFSAYWKPDRPLETPPLAVAGAIVFVGTDQRVVSYSATGDVLWQAGPFGDHLEKAVVSGDLLALSTGNGGNFNLYVLTGQGKILFQAAAQSPIVPSAAQNGGFYVMVGPQVGRLGPDGQWLPFLDAGIVLGRAAQITVDKFGEVYLYPGYGEKLFAFSGGKLRWTTKLVGVTLQPPLLEVGGGCLLYVLTGDGALQAYKTSDGSLGGTATLYPGGARSHSAARWLRVDANDRVQFSAGYLTVASVDGPTLAGIGACGSQ